VLKELKTSFQLLSAILIISKKLTTALATHTDLREATKTANTVRLEVCQTSLIRHIPNRLVTMSAGVASSSESTEPGNLLKIADNRLYKAKNSGRNRVMPQQ